MDILVAGGAGFIGSFLVESLLEDGHTVAVADNFITGHRLNVPKSVRLFEVDISKSASEWPEEMWGHRWDYIYNLASPASPDAYNKYPWFTFETCVRGTEQLLSIAQVHGARFIQASTSEVYGDPIFSPQTEAYWGNVNPIGVRACYDEGKRAAEFVCAERARRKKPFDANIRIARIFNTYGPRMSPLDGRVISNFVTQALNRERLTVYGDGTQTRSFCYVSDMVVGLRALAAKNMPEFCGPINLGNPVEMRIKDVADMVCEAVGVKADHAYLPLPEDDPRRRLPSIAKARQILGWGPLVSFKEGLEKTIDWHKQIRGQK